MGQKCSEINIAEYIIPGYSLFINSPVHRGVLIYIKVNLDAQECTELNENTFDESVWIYFKDKDGLKILLGCIYKSPNTTKENEEKLLKLLNNKAINTFDRVCIMGDFNFPNIDWEGTWVGERENKFMECLNDAYLIQMVKNPTRRREGQKSNILDLIMVNDAQFISDIEHHCPIGKSDHDLLIFNLGVKTSSENDGKLGLYKFDFQKGRFDKMREELHRVDRSVLDTAGVDEAWDCIKLKIIQLMEQNIPKVKVKCNEKPKPIWFNKSVWRIIKKKYYVFKRFLETKSGKDYLHYIEIRNKTNKEIRKASRENEKSIAKECKSNPKRFWKYVRTKTKAKTGISPLRKRNGDIAF